MTDSAFQIRPCASHEDEHWLADLWRAEWGSEMMVTKGRTHRLADMEARIAWDGSSRVGAATFRFGDDGCELMSLNALKEGSGVGTALLASVEAAAREAQCRRVWLVTSNDNLDALRFYQRRQYRLAAVYPGSIDAARQIKPSIPLIGNHGIPIHDDIELEKWLSSPSSSTI